MCFDNTRVMLSVAHLRTVSRSLEEAFNQLCFLPGYGKVFLLEKVLELRHLAVARIEATGRC